MRQMQAEFHHSAFRYKFRPVRFPNSHGFHSPEKLPSFVCVVIRSKNSSARCSSPSWNLPSLFARVEWVRFDSPVSPYASREPPLQVYRPVDTRTLSSGSPAATQIHARAFPLARFAVRPFAKPRLDDPQNDAPFVQTEPKFVVPLAITRADIVECVAGEWSLQPRAVRHRNPRDRHTRPIGDGALPARRLQHGEVQFEHWSGRCQFKNKLRAHPARVSKATGLHGIGARFQVRKSANLANGLLALFLTLACVETRWTSTSLLFSDTSQPVSPDSKASLAGHSFRSLLSRFPRRRVGPPVVLLADQARPTRPRQRKPRPPTERPAPQLLAPLGVGPAEDRRPIAAIRNSAPATRCIRPI